MATHLGRALAIDDSLAPGRVLRAQGRRQPRRYEPPLHCHHGSSRGYSARLHLPSVDILGEVRRQVMKARNLPPQLFQLSEEYLL